MPKIGKANGLEFKTVTKVPAFKPKTVATTEAQKVVLDFHKGGHGAMTTVCKSEQQASSVVHRINTIASRMNLPIKAGIRNLKDVYIWRTDKAKTGSHNGEMIFSS